MQWCAVVCGVRKTLGEKRFSEAFIRHPSFVRGSDGINDDGLENAKGRKHRTKGANVWRCCVPPEHVKFPSIPWDG